MGIISTPVSMTAVYDGENSVRLALDNEHEDFLYSDGANANTLVSPIGGATSEIHLYDGLTDKRAQITSGTLMVDFSGSTGVPTTGANAPKISGYILTVPQITADTAKVVVKATYNGTVYYAAFTANRTKGDKYDLVVKPNAIAFNPSSYTQQTISLEATGISANGSKIFPTISTSATLTAGNFYIFYSFVNADGTMDTPTNLRGTTLTVTKANCTSYAGVYFELRRYITASEHRLCDYETVEIAKVENGKNSVRIDLDNQADLVSCDADGKVRYNRTVKTKARLYDGATMKESGVTAKSATITVKRKVNGSYVSTSLTSSPTYGNKGAEYSWAILADDILETDVVNLDIELTYGNVPYTANFTLSRTDMAEIFQVTGNPTAITFSKSSDNEYTPDSVAMSFWVGRNSGKEISQYAITSQDPDAYGNYAYYRVRDAGVWKGWLAWTNSYPSGSAVAGLSFSNGNLVVAKDTTATDIEVALTTSWQFNEYEVLDREVVPIIKDGINGESVYLTISPDKITIPCTPQGYASAAMTLGIRVQMYVGTQLATNLAVTKTTEADGISLSSAQGWEVVVDVSTIAHVNGSGSMATGIALTVSGKADGKTYTAKGTIALIGTVKGDNGYGETGHVGRWYYYAGEYDGTPSHYAMESTRAPYVSRSGSYYMLDNQGVEPASHTMTATQHPNASGQTQWSPMQSTFKYMITEAIFSNNAHLGSFIFNGDWMISQHGTIDGVGSDEYTAFDPYDPTGQASGNFCPNMAIDGRTGIVYMNAAYVRGNTYKPFTIITSDNYYGYVDVSGYLNIPLGQSYQIMSLPDNMETLQSNKVVKLPNIASSPNLVGCEIEIANMTDSNIYIKGFYPTMDFNTTGQKILLKHYYARFKAVFTDEPGSGYTPIVGWICVGRGSLDLTGGSF